MARTIFGDMSFPSKRALVPSMVISCRKSIASQAFCPAVICPSLSSINRGQESLQKYDPKDYWNSKARAFKGDVSRAACTTSPILNVCIERTQRRAIEACFRDLNQGDDHPKGRVLDFGCGSGRWVESLSGFGEEYVGVDISDEMVEICRSRYPGKRFETMDQMSIPCPSDYFDVAFSIAVIHHNSLEDQESLILELSRVLKPGGMLFLFESVGLEAINREFPRPVDQWIEVVSSCGFECISRRHYEYWPIGKIWDEKIGLGSPFRGVILRLDRLISPLLSERLVSADSGRVALLFQHSGE